MTAINQDQKGFTMPTSIRLFERLYLLSLALYILNIVLFWSQTREVMNRAPQVAANPTVAALVGGIMIGSLVVTVLASLLFWWLVTRQRNVAGKWLVVVTEGIGAVVGVFTLVKLLGGHAPNAAGAALGLLVTVLGVAAAAMLFRPDAKAWLGERHADTGPLA